MAEGTLTPARQERSTHQASALSLYFFFSVVGFELGALHLLGRHSTLLEPCPQPFLLQLFFR
jgi:hypothetical protein